MKPIEQYCVLLGAPWPLSKLIRIKLLVKADLCNKHGKADTGSILGSSESGSYASELKTTLERSCQQLCKGLNDDRPGNLLVAVPDHDAQHCIVLCPKSKLSEVYRALHACQSKKGFWLRDVKSSVILAPPSEEQLAGPILQALKNVLSAAAWFPASDQLLSCNYLDSPPGRVKEAICLENLGTMTESSSILFIFTPSTIRFRPLIAGHQGKKEDSADFDLKHLQECHIDAACIVLPSRRAAWIVEIVPTAANVSIARDASLLCDELLEADWERSMLLVSVKFWQEDDAPQYVYPACCIWSATGLSTMPVKLSSQQMAVRQLAGNLEACSADLWGGQSLKVATYGILKASPQTAALPDATWMTAHQLPCSTETISNSGSRCTLVSRCLRDHVRSFNDMSGTCADSSEHQQCLPSTELLQKLAELSCEEQGAARTRLTEQKGKPLNLSALAPAEPLAVCSSACMEKTKPAGKTCNPQIQQTPPQQNLAPKAPVLKTRMKPFSRSIAKHNQSSLAAPVKAKSAKAAAQTARKPKAAKERPPSKLLTVLEEPGPEGEEVSLEKATQKSQMGLGSAKVVQMSLEGYVAGREGGQSMPSIRIEAGAASACDVPQPAPQHHKTKRGTEIMKEKTGDPRAPPRKRTKAADLDIDAVTDKMQQKNREGKLKDLTVPEMKCYLKSHNLPVGGKKEEILTRLSDLLKT